MLYLSLVFVFILSYSFYFYGKKRALSLKFKKNENLSSLPDYYGYYVVLLVFFPAIIIWFFLLIFKSNFQEMFVMSPVLFPDVATWSSGKFGLVMNKISNLSMIVNLSEIDLTVGDKSILKMASESEIIAAKNLANFDKIYGWSNLTLFIILPVLLGFLATKSISGKLNAQPIVEKIISYVIKGSSYIAIFITFGIFFSLVFEAINFFRYVNFMDFFFNTAWNPNRAFVINASEGFDQEALKEAFGFVPLLTGTLLIASVAMLVAVPLGLLTAIYLAEYASSKVRDIAKPIIEILAGIPTVVYGFFAALSLAPFIKDVGEGVGLPVSAESALAAGLAMGVMIIPFVSSLSDDVIKAVPQSLREGSYAIGATKSETIKKVILPAALAGIMGSFLLAISRAIGETMIVVMAASLRANLTFNPLEPATTITTQIVTSLIGDVEFDNPKTLVAFALGLTLFVMTLILNIAAITIVKKYREKYE
jgi:phosphate transport system permease protein